MRFQLTIAYDGTEYAGWQVQSNALSIQTILQKALQTVLRHPIALTGAGRTDAGVHALGQTAHFDTECAIDPDKFRYSVNAILPDDIRLLAIRTVSDDFHARYSAKGKIYHYHIQTGNILDPTKRLYRTPVYGPFDLPSLRSAARHFIGKHDFTSFANHGSKAFDSIRTLHRLDIVEEEGHITLEFEGDGFLYKMVRNIVGTLLDVAAGRTSPDDIPDLFNQKNRKKAGFCAAAQGLFLIKVIYYEPSYLESRQERENGPSSALQEIKDGPESRSELDMSMPFAGLPIRASCLQNR
jgi:tRNA pseudouridine38-40 synthase